MAESEPKQEAEPEVLVAPAKPKRPSSAAMLRSVLEPGSDGGLMPELDRLLAININNTTSVDAANLQKVLAFLVTGVQTLASAAVAAESKQAEIDAKLTAEVAEVRSGVTACNAKLDEIGNKVRALLSQP